MKQESNRWILVTGATGLQGGAVACALLRQGWKVRALTRQPESEKARSLAAAGAEVVQGDMSDLESLRPVFEGAYGVYSVQNPVLSGIEGEIRQGKNVGEAASQAGVLHFVYASAGTGARGTEVPSWESKLEIEDHLLSLGLPLTVLRPMAFMELMTEKKFFPQVSTWQVMPKMMGETRKVVWLSVEDLGVIAANIFANPDGYIGRDLKLASDMRSISECREIYREVFGKNPPRFPMPSWIFRRFGFIGEDLSKMWRWLRTAQFELDTHTAHSIHPEALSVRACLQKQAKHEGQN